MVFSLGIRRTVVFMTTLDFSVTGMTCQHCVTSVTNELTSVSGVDSVKVDLANGVVTVSGTALEENALVSAIAEAGYAATRAT